MTFLENKRHKGQPTPGVVFYYNISYLMEFEVDSNDFITLLQ